MTDNREYRARIHIMVDDIESNHRLRQLHALIYRMHERDVADRLRTERQEGTPAALPDGVSWKRYPKKEG